MKPSLQVVSVDWFSILWDLAQRDWTTPRIAQHTGIGIATLYGYRDGSHPVHWRGEMLLELWCAICQKARQDAPRATVVLTPRVVIAPAQVQDRGALAELESAWRARA